MKFTNGHSQVQQMAKFRKTQKVTENMREFLENTIKNIHGYLGFERILSH
jgi:hypothetical protein